MLTDVIAEVVYSRGHRHGWRLPLGEYSREFNAVQQEELTVARPHLVILGATFGWREQHVIVQLLHQIPERLGRHR